MSGGVDTASIDLLIVSANAGAGGAERQLVELANGLDAVGRRVAFATWNPPCEPDFYPLAAGVRRVYLGVHVRTGPFAGMRSVVARIVALRGLLRRQRPRLVLSFIAETNVLALLAAWGWAPTVVSERAHPETDTTVSPNIRFLRRFIYRRARAIVAQTASAARWIEASCGACCQVVPNSLRNLPDLDLPRDTRILAVGRLTRQKGFDVLLHAFASIAAEFPAWNISILGDGPERRSLATLAAELGIAGRVEFAGVHSDIERWFARAGLVVQPSRFEGFPNVVLEAMGMGAAVISADCEAGPRELIRDGVNGRLVAVDDAPGLAAAMTSLMKSPDERARLGTNARDVRQTYRRDRILQSWESLLFDHGATA